MFTERVHKGNRVAGVNAKEIVKRVPHSIKFTDHQDRQLAWRVRNWFQKIKVKSTRLQNRGAGEITGFQANRNSMVKVKKLGNKGKHDKGIKESCSENGPF